MKFEFEVDTKVEDEGQWVRLDDLQEGFEIKLRSTRSEQYRALQSKKFAKLRSLGRMKPQRLAEESQRITRECIEEACILDWRGLKDRQGVEVPFDRNLAHAFMHDRKYALAAESISAAAQQVGFQEEEEEEQITGN